jgi:pilus assembly protein CpaC
LAILPSFTSRRAKTTVQLVDGQSFAIGGLIKNNTTTNIRAFPVLGELPIIGALFRSTEFQTDKSELVFVITPRLVKPLPPGFALPTDNYVPPSRTDVHLHGRLEGRRPDAPAPEAAAPAAPGASAASGFQVK